MTDPNDKFLFFAYGLVWIVFVIYAWVMTRRQSKLRHELEELKSKAEERQPIPKP